MTFGQTSTTGQRAVLAKRLGLRLTSTPVFTRVAESTRDYSEAWHAIPSLLLRNSAGKGGQYAIWPTRTQVFVLRMVRVEMTRRVHKHLDGCPL